MNLYSRRHDHVHIGEVADRTGFTASALWYYEDIGLVEPAARTDAGYRVYDETTLPRLAFIGRAKQLGCTLEEITDLVGIWDAERCAPVQRRFHELVTTKMADAEHKIRRTDRAARPTATCRSTTRGPGYGRPVRRDVRLSHLRRDHHEGGEVSPARERLGIVGIGAGACVACCAGPLLAFLGGISVVGLASAALIGTVGRVIAAMTLAAALIVRSRRRACAPTNNMPTPVAAPIRRPSNLSRSAQ
jgi:DNA-binding transcriptional MerR regulator